jgi:hypothetical protein
LTTGGAGVVFAAAAGCDGGAGCETFIGFGVGASATGIDSVTGITAAKGTVSAGAFKLHPTGASIITILPHFGQARICPIASGLVTRKLRWHVVH